MFGREKFIAGSMIKFRKDLGDLSGLKKSIEKHGLIHPIIVDSNGELIAGERRLKACQELGVEPEYRIIDFDDPVGAQVDENTERKDFTPSEIYAISQYYNKKLNRQGHNKGNDGKFTVLSESDRTEYPRDLVSNVVGVSTDTLARINSIFESDDNELKQRVDAGRTSIDKAYKQIKKQSDIIGATTERTNISEFIAPTVYNESCNVFLDQIEDKSVDLLITDPPYSTEIKDDIDAWVRGWIYKAVDKVKDTGRIFICIGAYPKEINAYLTTLLETEWIVDCPLIWTYRNTLGVTPKMKYNLNYQVILHLYKDSSNPLDNRITSEMFSVQDINAPDGRVGDRVFKWQKPNELARRLIQHTTKPGDKVIDPFVGSGSFVVQAGIYKREATGCDVDKDVLRIAEKNGCIVQW